MQKIDLGEKGKEEKKKDTGGKGAKEKSFFLFFFGMPVGKVYGLTKRYRRWNDGRDPTWLQFLKVFYDAKKIKQRAMLVLHTKKKKRNAHHFSSVSLLLAYLYAKRTWCYHD